MSPTVVDLPHSLGRAEAKRRIASRLGELPRHLPGGAADIRTTWPGDYVMALEITARGQRVSATPDVQEHVIRVTMMLPPIRGFMAGAISAAVQIRGGQLLLGNSKS